MPVGFSGATGQPSTTTAAKIEIAQLRQAYLDAQARTEALSRHEDVAIQAVLARPA